MWIFSSFLSLLADNLILTRALGTSTLMAASKNRSNLVILSLMMTLFSVLGSVVTALLYRFIPQLANLMIFPVSVFQPLLYAAVISAEYILVLLILYLIGGEKSASVRKYVHLSAFNCAVMGTLYLCFSPDQFTRDAVMPAEFLGLQFYFDDRLSPLRALLFGLQTGLGFLLASLMLLAVRKRLYSEEVPAAFRGFPAVLVYIGLISMAVHAIAA